MQEDLSADDASIPGDDLQDRQRRHRLAAAALPDHTDGTAARDLEGDPVHGAHRTAVARKMGLQVPDFQQRAVRHTFRSSYRAE